ncbi:MAG TPA: LptF/LptG family permease, partial [Candidatus Limnocylindrales bacterium]|nr:LptF/LptG family permease [Candidatus Limnocylindrales bacterium]
MTILSRYLFREFFRMVAVCIAGFLVLFLVIDFVESADQFLLYRATVGEILRYYLFRVPGVFITVSPIAVLVAVLITVSLRARTNEFTAMFSVGISPLRAFAPLIAGCALISALALGSSELLAPKANRLAREIARLRVRPGRVAAQFSLNRYWIRGDNAVLSAQVIDTAGRVLHGFQYLEIDRDFRLVRRVDARVAEVTENGKWRLRDGRERRTDGDQRADPFAEREFPFPETIQGFLDGETPPEEMTYEQLAAYIGDSQSRGYDVRRYEVDLHAKLSYPLLNVIVGLLASPLALRTPRSGGVWRSIG